MKTKAILFDLVGTLIYIKNPVGYVYSTVARSYGFETDYQKLDMAFQEVIHNEPRAINLKITEKQRWKKIVLKTFKLAGYDLGNKFDDMFEELFEIFSQKSAWVVYPDVVSVLETCHGKSLQTGLISNFDSRLEIILQELDLRKYFHCIAYSGKVGFSKPDSKIFQYALNELNVLPEEALYIGDSLNIDYYPAYDLGINALLVDRERANKVSGIKTIFGLNELFSYV